MKRIFAASLLLLVPSCAFAASAIVHDADSGAYGYSFNQASISIAARNAMENCTKRSASCTQLATYFGDGYSALAVGSRTIGYALGRDDDLQARDDALAMCQRQADDCVLRLLWRERKPNPHQSGSVPAPRIHPPSHSYPDPNP